MLDTTERTLNPATETPARAKTPTILPFHDEEDDEGTAEMRAEMLGHYEDSLRSIGEGEIVRGTVLAVDDKEVLVDVGFKSEGVIALSEFPDPASIKVGTVIDVFLEKMENQDGLVVLSKQRADFVRVWDRVKEAHDTGQVVEGRLVRKIKGGVVVDLYEWRPSCPARRSRCARCRTSTRCWARRSRSRSSSSTSAAATSWCRAAPSSRRSASA
jgi:small subunit ribosomal protein S1